MTLVHWNRQYLPWLAAVAFSFLLGQPAYAHAHQKVAAAKADTRGSGSDTTETKKSEDSKHLLPPIKWGEDEEWELQPGGEVRARGEYRKNFDMMSGRRRDDDLVGFLRTKLNAELTYRSMVRTFIEIMDAREIGARQEYQQESYADLHQIYVDLPLSPGAQKLKEAAWSIRLGRQEIDLGRDRRLSEASGWNNLRRRFDGAKLMYRTKQLDVDIFAVQPNYYERRRGDDTITRNGRRRDDEWFYGAYATSRHHAPHTIEAYFLGLSDRKNRRTFPERRSEDGTYGTLDRYTVGSVIYGPLHEDERGELTYTAEGAYQFGHTSKDPISAFFLRGDTTYTWKRPWKPSLGLVATLVSGDKNPTDGRSDRFDMLFGSSHSPYGIMDFVRSRNFRELAIVGKIEPTKKLSLQAEAHAFWLDSKTDSWSNAPGQPSLRDKTGRSGRSLGQEISLVAEYKHSERLSLEAGAAHFFPGSFPGAFGRNDGANFFYLQTRWRF